MIILSYQCRRLVKCVVYGEARFIQSFSKYYNFHFQMIVIIGCLGIHTISICAFQRVFNSFFTRYDRSLTNGKILENGKLEPGLFADDIFASFSAPNKFVVSAIGNRK